MVAHQVAQPQGAATRTRSRPGGVILLAKPGSPTTGVGRYTHMLHAGLVDAGVATRRVAPTVPPLPGAGYALLRRLGLDAPTFLTNYPMWADFPVGDVYHLTSQNLASVLLVRRPKRPVIVTVHDIIPYMLRHDRQLCAYRTPADRLCDHLAMAGLQRADRLIADSYYTKRCLERHLGIPGAKIAVVSLGIDHARFRPLAVPTTLRARYGLPDGRRYLIYVGSEDPRKNLATLLRALAKLRYALPEVELIKVGRAHFDQQRQRLLDLAGQLGLRPAIHFLDDVPEEDLPLLYNLAEVCVLPSRYEGFGFPVLEAMACGTPVVCTRAASLPELAGDAGVLVEDGREAAGALAAAVLALLTDRSQYHARRARGLDWAARFQWSATTRLVLDEYARAATRARETRTRPGEHHHGR